MSTLGIMVKASVGRFCVRLPDIWGTSVSPSFRIGVLTANNPARAFYEAMGGREIGHGTDDEEGYLLPVTIYGWADITDLDPGSSSPANRTRAD